MGAQGPGRFVASGLVALAAGFGPCTARGPCLGGSRSAPPPGPVTRAEDTDRDGRPDRWTEYDPSGRTRTKVSEDRNRDGVPDRVQIYVDGRLNRVDYDSDGDGRLDQTDQISSTGHVLFTLTDRDWNTVPERWVQHGARGRITSEWIDANQDAAPEIFRSFDTAGRLTEEGHDADADGLYETNRIFNTRWPAGAHPSRIDRDDDRDGVFERRESYDAAGALLAINLDTDGDGIRERLTLLRGGAVIRDGYDRDGNGHFEEWRFPVPGGVRVAHDDDDDYDLDRWDPPGPPAAWCAARCRTAPAR